MIRASVWMLPGGIRPGQLAISTIVCIITWSLVLLLYGYQHRQSDGFVIGEWFAARRGTFIFGIVVTVMIALLRAFTKDMAQLLTVLGFQPGPSAAVSLGLAIAALLLGFKPTIKSKDGEQE